MNITCKKCKSLCEVDGEYPKFFAWCDTCNSYADHDMFEFSVSWYAGLIDYTYDTMKERANND